MLKYNECDTLNNPVAISNANCVKLLDDIIFKDDDSLLKPGNLFQNNNVIDLDNVEINLAKLERRQQNKTMDCAFLVTNKISLTPFRLNNNLNFRGVIFERVYSNVQLVELRLNFENAKQVKQKDLQKKIDGSIRIFTPYNLSVRHLYIFVFKSSFLQQMRRRMRNMNPSWRREYKVMHLAELNATYF